jgi:hypothetical protein
MILPNEGGFMTSEQQDQVGFKLPIEIQAEVRARFCDQRVSDERSESQGGEGVSMASMDVDIAASILAASHRPPHSTLSSSLFAVRSSQVFAKPPKYVQVSSLKYIAGNRPKRNPHTDMCTCVSVENGGNGCDENCLNAMMFIEVRVGEEQRGAKRLADKGRALGNNDLRRGLASLFAVVLFAAVAFSSLTPFARRSASTRTAPLGRSAGTAGSARSRWPAAAPRGRWARAGVSLRWTMSSLETSLGNMSARC